jgi:hypothetical protein
MRDTVSSVCGRFAEVQGRMALKRRSFSPVRGLSAWRSTCVSLLEMRFGAVQHRISTQK